VSAIHALTSFKAKQAFQNTLDCYGRTDIEPAVALRCWLAASGLPPEACKVRVDQGLQALRNASLYAASISAEGDTCSAGSSGTIISQLLCPCSPETSIACSRGNAAQGRQATDCTLPALHPLAVTC
jgi:hypothetical protein